jgi:SHS2 domain-containing protein
VTVAGYEVLEHTADVGLRARGETLEETFRQAAIGLLELMGQWEPSSEGEATVPVEASSGDLGALLVEWLNETVYLIDVRDGPVAAVQVDLVSEGRASGALTMGVPSEAEPEGTPVKAVTYHQLRVEREDGGWVAEVYVDV